MIYVYPILSSTKTQQKKKQCVLLQRLIQRFLIAFKFADTQMREDENKSRL